jgi:hypothetical protein
MASEIAPTANAFRLMGSWHTTMAPKIVKFSGEFSCQLSGITGSLDDNRRK